MPGGREPGTAGLGAQRPRLLAPGASLSPRRTDPPFPTPAHFRDTAGFWPRSTSSSCFSRTHSPRGRHPPPAGLWPPRSLFDTLAWDQLVLSEPSLARALGELSLGCRGARAASPGAAHIQVSSEFLVCSRSHQASGQAAPQVPTSSCAAA